MTFNEWLESPDQRRTVLLEIGYLKGGNSGLFRCSNRPFTSTPSDTTPSVPFDDVILGGLTYGVRMTGQTGGFSMSVGSVVLAASPEVIDVAAGEVAGQPVRVYLGDQRWSRDQFQLVSVLTAESLEPESVTAFRLNFRTETRKVEDPLNIGTISTGTNKDKPKPILLGDCLNIKPVQVDAAGLVWAVSDGAVTSIGNVRVNGVVTSVTKNTAAGTITFSSAPSGTVTCDAVGAGGSTVKDLFNVVLNRLGIASIDATTMNSLPAYTVGLYSEGNLTARTVFDYLARSVGGYWGFDRLGRFRVGLINKPSGSPTALLTPDDIALNGVSYGSRTRPATAVEITYDANHTIQSGEMPSSVAQADRERWGKSGQTFRATNAGISTAYPDAELKETTTVIRGLTHATAEANKRALFYSSPVKVFTVEAFAVPFAFEVGQEIKLIYPYFGMNEGVNAVVLSITDNPLKGQTTLEVLINA